MVLRSGSIPGGAPMTRLDDLIDLIESPGDECIEWPYGTSGGYGRLRINGHARPAHRVALELTEGPRLSANPWLCTAATIGVA